MSVCKLHVASIDPDLAKKHRTPSSGLSCLVEANGGLANVEEDEMLALMRHKSLKVAADDAVPGRAVLAVEVHLWSRARVRMPLNLPKHSLNRKQFFEESFPCLNSRDGAQAAPTQQESIP